MTDQLRTEPPLIDYEGEAFEREHEAIEQLRHELKCSFSEAKEILRRMRDEAREPI